MASHRFNKGKAQSEPRLKPSVQTNRRMNPIFAKIVKIVEKTGGPEMYRRDIAIDRSEITRKHPSAVIWGYRDTGTELVTLSRGVRGGSPKEVQLWKAGGSHAGSRGESWQMAAVKKVRFWSKNSTMHWFYITPKSARKVTGEEAVSIIFEYAGIKTMF